MSCSSNRLCKNLIISTAVTYDAAADTLAVDLPQGTYANCGKYCIVIAQQLPATTTITAPVVFTIGGDAQTTYPLVNPNGTAVYAYQVATRTRYSTCVHTDVASGVFQLMGRIPCSCCNNRNNAAPSLPIAATE